MKRILITGTFFLAFAAIGMAQSSSLRSTISTLTPITSNSLQVTGTTGTTTSPDTGDRSTFYQLAIHRLNILRSDAVDAQSGLDVNSNAFTDLTARIAVIDRKIAFAQSKL